MDRATLTADLKPLERPGLVQIAVDTADRRSRRLMLTEAARRLLQAAVPIWQRTHQQAKRLLARRPWRAGVRRGRLMHYDR